MRIAFQPVAHDASTSSYGEGPLRIPAFTAVSLRDLGALDQGVRAVVDIGVNRGSQGGAGHLQNHEIQVIIIFGAVLEY